MDTKAGYKRLHINNRLAHRLPNDGTITLTDTQSPSPTPQTHQLKHCPAILIPMDAGSTVAGSQPTVRTTGGAT